MGEVFTEPALAALSDVLSRFGPEPVLRAIGERCARVAADAVAAGQNAKPWVAASSAAREAAHAVEGAEHASSPPANAPIANDNAEREDDALPADEEAPASSPARRPEGIRMSKDQRLGPRPADVTHWRCRRIDESKKGALLFHGGDDGVETSEWPIKTCSPETIRDWFGPGVYVAQYIRTDSNGQRMPRGRSRVVQIVARAVSEATVATPPVPSPSAPPPLAVPQASLISAPPSAAPDGIAHVFSLLAFLQDRDEKARAAAREEARLANERYRADTELVIERERIAMQERVAAMQAAQRSTARLPVSAGSELAELREELAAMREEVQQVIESAGDSSPTPSAAPPPPPADGFSKLVEILQPMLPLIVNRLTSAPTMPAPLPQGSDHAAE